MSPLDASQTAVVNIPISKRQVVIAAPGSGKTFAAVELIKHIDSQLEFPEDHDVIYISFSNAAIGAAIQDGGKEFSDLDVVIDAGTLDSFANALVSENNLNFDHSSNFFEDRVRAAIDIVKEGRTSHFDETVHLIIDEAQDIYGYRKQLALEVIESLPSGCGVTILGDPMQTIYSFLGAANSENKEASGADSSLLQDILDHPGTSPKRLTGQYRATSAKMRRTHTHLRSIDYSAPRKEQVPLIEQALTEATAIDASNLSYWSRKWGRDTTLLTRNNAEVIQLCDVLADQNIVVSPLLPPEQRTQFPSWISAWSEEIGSGPFAPTDLFDFLQKGDPDDLKDAISTGYDFSNPWKESTLSDIASAFRYRPGYSIHAKDQTRPLVSTIHQSKGRQFETVVLVNPFELIRDDPFYGSETELSYVGITRARKKLQMLELKFPRMRSFQAPHHRSIIHSYARSAPHAIEIKPSDIDREDFYGESVGQEALKILAPSVKLEFSLVHQDSPVPRYRLQIDGTTVGLTSTHFGESIAKLTRTRPRSWPILGPVMHDGTETVFGNENIQGRPSWLVPRAFGFSTISFS